MTNFADWFVRITTKKPFPYQERLARESELPIILLVPTGAGKTAAVILSWLWRRRFHPNRTIRAQTPRRLIYCLPMRTLVEQTYASVKTWLENAELTQEVESYLLMGGAISDRWDAHPEKDCILIGTQDQLLSRALNRGYGMSRYRWPIHFALLNNDCFWVMDEVQLMGAGISTTAQLQGFREEFKTYGPTKSLWMSATLNPELLQTVNYQPDLSKLHQLNPEDKAHPILKERMQACKQLCKANTVITGNEEDYAKALALEVSQAHIPGKLTLVICNRVSRAQALFKALNKQIGDELLLIHSRFRPYERQQLNQKLRGTSFGILVATQVVEAGVDISAQTLFTELAPWSSLVQRFGRCNRYGECSDSARVYCVDIDLNKKRASSPYQNEDLEEARSLLAPLTDVGLESLQQVEAKLKDPQGLIPRRHDLLQLFDTSTDLAGHDIDISSFIRESSDTDVAIAWRNWEGDQPKRETQGALRQEELCRVSLERAREFLEYLKKQKRFAWVWDSLQGEWVKVTSLYPGISLLLHCSDGGYSMSLGFTGDPKDKPEPVEAEIIEPDLDDADPLTDRVGTYIALADHSQDVALEVRELCESFSEYSLRKDLLERAGRWHDLGKAHPAFQEMMIRDRPDKAEGGPWAKSEQKTRILKERQGFRHELVSALVALQEEEDFLLAYLTAAHHGKIRLSIQPRNTKNKSINPQKKFVFGVEEGDEVPEVNLGNDLVIPPQTLSLNYMKLGDGKHGESWTTRALALLEEHGPFKLAFLETIIRIADWRASAKYASDILRRTDA